MPMTLTSNFHGQLWKKNWISGMGGWINMEWKESESLRCWTHYVTFNYDLDLGLSRSHFEISISQEWDGQMTWNEGMWIDRLLNPLCDLDLSYRPWPWTWIFKVKFSSSHISGLGGLIDMEQKKMLDMRLNPLCNHELWPQLDIELLDLQGQILR